MTIGKGKRTRDPNQLAKWIVDRSTEEKASEPELAGSVPIAAPPSTLVDRRTVQIVVGAAGIEPCMPLLGRDLSVGELCRVGDYGDPARLARG